MFDFVSTRAETPIESRREAQMLASFVALRLRDAASPSSVAERREEKNLNPEAITAIRYFFETDTAFDRHIELIGGSADTFRAALLGKHPLPVKGLFTDAQRRVIQLRHHWWRTN